MKKDAVKVNFSMSYGDLYNLCIEKAAFVKRDLAEFENFGITDLQLISFQEKAEMFAAYPSDNELLSAQVRATAEKIAKAEELKDAIRLMIFRLKLLHANQGIILQDVKVKDLSRLNDGNLYLVASRIYRVIKQYAENLKAFKLDALQIEDFGRLIDAFKIAIEKQDIAISQREIATSERIERANNLYNWVQMICSIGKQIWYTRDKTRYNDFLIYEQILVPEDETMVETPENETFPYSELAV